jgi:ribonuclease D
VARAGLAALATEHRMPVENLVSPDLVRRLTWTPPAEDDAAGVRAALLAGGARRWQVALVTPCLVDALAATAASVAEADAQESTSAAPAAEDVVAHDTAARVETADDVVVR